MHKILVLHGAGGSSTSMAQMTASLETALGPLFQFVFLDAPYYKRDGSAVWYEEPPNGRMAPTTDSSWASKSNELLDATVAEHGPFFAILGYSQGSAFATYYLSTVPDDTFQAALLFCGSLIPEHLGLMQSIDGARPLHTPAIIYSGEMDGVVPTEATLQQAGAFSYPRVVVDPRGKHALPQPSSPSFEKVVNFVHGELLETTDNFIYGDMSGGL